MKAYPLEIGEKTRYLRYGFNAFCAFEEKSNKGLAEIGKNPKMSDMRVLLWAGLIHEDKKLTLERAGNLVDEYIQEGGTFQDLMEITTKALNASGIIKDDKEEEPGES